MEFSNGRLSYGMQTWESWEHYISQEGQPGAKWEDSLTVRVWWFPRDKKLWSKGMAG